MKLRFPGTAQPNLAVYPDAADLYNKAAWLACFLSSLALAATGLLKLLSLASHQRILDANDPVFGVPNFIVLFAAGFLDLTFAVFLLLWRNLRVRLLLLFWLGVGFCLYHIGLLILNPDAPCPCLGTLYGRMGLTTKEANTIAQWLAAWCALAPAILWIFVKLQISLAQIKSNRNLSGAAPTARSLGSNHPQQST